MVASSSDWVGYNNPTGWGYPPEYINVGAHGLVGHCWKALTITTTYDAPKTVTGIQTDSVKPFSIEHSSDGGSTWVLVGNDFNGSENEIPLEPFTCEMTRMTWADTSGSNGFHAQFVGGDASSGEEEEDGESGGEAKAAEEEGGGGDNPRESSGEGSGEDNDSCEGENESGCESEQECPDACIDELFADAAQQLHEEIEACRQSAEEAMSDAVSETLSEQDDSRSELDERIAEGLASFNEAYEAQVNALQASLTASHAEHVRRISEAREGHAKSREEKLQQAMDAMRAKIDAVRARVEDEFSE